MIIEHETLIEAPVERVWTFLGDMRAVSSCVPGVVAFDEVGEDAYVGTMVVQVGPIKAQLCGQVRVVDRDAESLRSSMTVQAADKRLGSTMSAIANLTLVPAGDRSTRMRIHTEASIFGKLGDFGQAVMRRKAEQIIDGFAANATTALGRSGGGASR